ncbi:filamentous hemagglutinin N-terminal domain-containing protein [Pleurocapsales cyanobacterium LEGE 10410]|nr:filamentous hemagglutinin N-terminal domain-containing protein [Pleurocapsales cyanobacterium LEGE 10410]
MANGESEQQTFLMWCKVRGRQGYSQIGASCSTIDCPDKAKQYGRLSRGLLLSGLTSWCLINAGLLQAQITSDNTVGTKVNSTDNVTEITGGTTADSNLFHSFQDFSVETDNTAFFNNASNISNIIGRVTGGNLSNIDGLIKANGNANLILINPSGINFGGNASLDIGGSFLGSTADSLIFEDGTVFGTTEVAPEPLLTITAPIGLQLGKNSAAIQVTGSGHDLSVVDPLFSPIIFGEQSGLRVKPARTLGLLGGEITFNGGVIAAPGGRIELGSVAEGLVNINLTETNLSLSYEDTAAFSNLQLRSQSLADVSGTISMPGGSIQVQGRELALNDGSLLLVQNLADLRAGTIQVNTSESVTVSGTNPNVTIRSSITNETLGTGQGGDVVVSTSQLTVDDGAAIVAKTLQPGNATGGNVEINASESVRVIGSNRFNPSVTSSIAAASFGAGDGGNNNITTDYLKAIAGGTIVATALNTGNGGDLNITANTMEIIGIEPNILAASALTASTLGEGNAGNLTIDTSTIKILAGGRVDSSTIASGNAGNLNITATDSIVIDGTVPGSVNPSLIIAAGNIVDPAIQQVLNLPTTPTGDSGNITVNTPRLQITAGGRLTVRNDGAGNAGVLKVDANSILLDRQGSISADTQSGEGGNILLKADNFVLQGASFTSATAAGTGNGGNITIDSDSLVVLEDSQITADAFEGTGGNIQINTQGLFICRECSISASSSLGVDGVVDIEALEPNALNSFDIPQQLTQPQEEVAVACPDPSQDNSSRLTITGRGGLPNRPQDLLRELQKIKYPNLFRIRKDINKPMRKMR